MVAMALFGNTSYITTRTAHPEAYELTQEQAQAGLDTEVGTSPTQGCYDLYRLIALRRSQSGTSVQPNTCTQLAAPDDIAHQISLWLQILWLGPMGVRVSNTTYQMQQTPTAALYLSNEIWLKQGVLTGSNLQLAYDPGADIKIPAISTSGVSSSFPHCSASLSRACLPWQAMLRVSRLGLRRRILSQ
jgi:hypothetical protein